MYINFTLLYEKGLTDVDLIILQKVKQKELFISDESELNNLFNLNLIEKNKTDGRIRISKFGNSFLNDLEIPDLTDEIKDISIKAIEMYKNYNKPFGSKNEVLVRMAWFIKNTGFNPLAVLNEIESYLSVTDMAFISRLDNLLWKQPNAFSVHKTLKDSKLYDIFVSKYNLNEDYFMISTNKDYFWKLSISKLQVPKGSDFYFISYDADKKKIAELRNSILPQKKYNKNGH